MNDSTTGINGRILRFSFLGLKFIHLFFLFSVLSACGGSGDNAGEGEGNTGVDDGGVEVETTGSSPGQPLNVSAVASNAQITISWDKVNNATGYDICSATESISQPANCNVHQNGELRVDQSSPAIITGLSNGVEYFFAVIPKNTKGDGITSTVVSATPAEPDPIPPIDITAIDLLEAVENGAKAGKWSEAEGIAAALNGFSGRQPETAGLSVSNVNTAGLTRLIRRATDLLAGNILLSKEKIDLELALKLFTHPPQDILDQISKPSNRVLNISSSLPSGSKIVPKEKTGLSISQNNKRLSRQAQTISKANSATECANLGIDQSELGADGKCFIYDELEDDNGNTVRVYYPNSAVDNPNAISKIDLTLDALIRSNDVYASLATVGDINLVFSFLRDKDSPTTYALETTFDPTQVSSCPLTVFLPANVGVTQDAYQQTIAHEVFHCVQDRTFSSFQSWWGEGAAEYFSNVVYPKANDEHSWIASFDEVSANNDLTAMSYQNTVFFQYYANRRGNAATISLLKGMADAGGALESVASITGSELWQDFVEAFMAGAILDTGGGKLSRGRLTTNNKFIKINQIGEVELSSKPMVATRYVVQYLQEKRFQQTPVGQAPHSVVLAKERSDTGAWSLLPPEVRSGCDEPENYIVVTTAVDEPRVFTIKVTNVEDAVCDACLLGPWEMRLNTFTEYLKSIFAANGITGSITDINGHYYFDFKETGEFASFRQPIIVTVTQDGFGLPIEISDTEMGDYSADGKDIAVFNVVGAGNGEVGVEGTPGIETPKTFLTGATSAYECVDDVLTISDKSLDPLVFDRIDKIPDPDGVDIEEGTIDSIN